MIALLFLAEPLPAMAQDRIQLNIVGGLGNVSQYDRFEKPFWSQKIEELSQGRIQATIHSSDGSGLPGQAMLQLIRLGVVPFGTALLALVSGDEPELNAVDLPTLNPTMAALRKTVSLYRPHIKQMLLNKYGIKLLGIYTYPAQVIFCAKPFTGLNDLVGRRVRTSSVGQSEMMAALGAVPVLTPFSQMVDAVRTGVVDCAITGTLSGNEIGLSNVTTHIHAMAISWGLSFFGANVAAWNALPADLRVVLQTGIKDLEQNIWDAADQETEIGLTCDIGLPSCVGRHRSHMTLVPVMPADEARRERLLVESVIPGWIQRCGMDCVQAWNDVLAPRLGIKANADQ